MTRLPIGAGEAGDGRREPEQWRSISLRNPWAWAVMYGGKTVENRTWGTRPGTVAIHAGLGFDPAALQSRVMLESWARTHKSALSAGSPHLDRGAIVGTVDIVGSHYCSTRQGCYHDADVIGWVPLDGSDASDEGWQPRMCSPWGMVPDRPPYGNLGRMRHFTLANPRPLIHPLPFTGHQGIRLLDPEVQRQVQVRLETQHARDL